jgi:hypothetical protein
MGVSSASFTDTYREKITDLMINLVEYVQCMDNLKNPSSPTGTGIGTATGPGNTLTPVINNIGPTQLPLEKNRNGFPILPDPLPNDLKKTAWEALFTEYLGQQYHLATGGKTLQIPYKRITENQKDFIDSKYLPRKTTFRPPRNITLQEMKGIFEYLLERQRIHGPEDTFKFKSIKLKGETVPSQYKHIGNDNNQNEDSDDNNQNDDSALGFNNDSLVQQPSNSPRTTNISNPRAGTGSGVVQDKAASSLPNQNDNSGPGTINDSLVQQPSNSPRTTDISNPRAGTGSGVVHDKAASSLPNQNDDAGPGPGPGPGSGRVHDKAASPLPQSVDGHNTEKDRPRPTPRPITRSQVASPLPQSVDGHNTVKDRPRPTPRPKTRSQKK